MPSILFRIALAVVLFGSAATHAQTPTILGVLEQNNYHSVAIRYPKEGYNRHYDWAVRALFQKEGSDWVEANDSTLPKAATFYAHGTTRPIAAKVLPPEYTFSGQAFFRLQSKRPATKVFPPNCFEEDDIRRYGVLSTQHYKRGPQPQPCPINSAAKQAIHDTILLNPFLRINRMAKDSALLDTPARIFYETQRHQMSGVVDAGLEDITGIEFSDANILAIGIFPPLGDLGDAYSITDSKFREDDSFPRIAFIVRPSGEVLPLYGDFDLLEYADYDGDGQVEYLCFYSQFNHYGYALFYDNWSKMVQRGWSYH